MSDPEDYRRLKQLRDELHEDLARWSEISNGRLITVMAPNPMHGFTAKKIVRQLVPYKYGDVIPIGELRIDTTGLPLYDDSRK